jgi:hypothetical protein
MPYPADALSVLVYGRLLSYPYDSLLKGDEI